MQKLNYPLNDYIKAVEIILKRKGLSHLKCFEGSKGSAVHFDLFEKDETKPIAMWQVHTEHNARRKITSKEDYKKACRFLGITMDEFIEVLNDL